MRLLGYGLVAALFGSTNACGVSEVETMPDKSDETGFELIVLAAPGSDDPYYAEVRSDILAFQRQFAQIIRTSGDEVLILADAATLEAYGTGTNSDDFVFAPQADIWARDFGLSNTVAPVMFRYTAEGQGGGRQGQRDADAVQEQLAGLAEDAGLSFAESDWLNDGGNWVDDGHGALVVSRKFLADNALSEAEARSVLREEAGVRDVAFVDADEQGGLEHADGVVAFVGPNTLIVNSYPDDPDYAADLRADLEAGLPGVTIHEIITPYDGSQIYDERFGSACGLYTNALVTEHRIYLPQFGIDADAVALQQVRAVTELEVIPVPSARVCHMGGGVRCLSWQLRGDNAERLLAYAARE